MKAASFGGPFLCEVMGFWALPAVEKTTPDLANMPSQPDFVRHVQAGPCAGRTKGPHGPSGPPSWRTWRRRPYGSCYRL